MQDPAALLDSPGYYLGDVDLDRRQFGFYAVDPVEFRHSAFQDEARTRGIRSERLAVDIGVAAARPTDGRRLRYILHTAFCCSTLLARCLDLPGKSIAFREPNVLMQLSNHKRLGVAGAGLPSHQLLDLSVRLLAKTANTGEAAIIKPTNAANNLAADILRAGSTAGVLLLYSKLEYFLASIIKKGEECRAFVRHLFAVVHGDSPRTRAIPPATLLALTDLQVATLLWYLQMDHYQALLREFPAAQIRTLDCDAFLADPARTLERLAAFFEIPLDAAGVQAVVEGEAFTRHSKSDGRDYDKDVRSAEYAKVLEENRSAIELTVKWGAQLNPDGPLRLPLPRGLLTD